MTIDENTYIDSVAFIGNSSEDWMATIYKKDSESPWQLEYRFRYYKFDEAGNTGNPKRFFVVTAKDGSEETLLHMRNVLSSLSRIISLRFGEVPIQTVEIQGGSNKFMDEIARQPWAHLRVKTEKLQ